MEFFSMYPISGVARRTALAAAALACLGMLSGCGSLPTWLPSGGPRTAHIQPVERTPGSAPPVAVIELTDTVARDVSARHRQGLFSDAFATPVQAQYTVGPGDVIEVALWEAPPAALFGATPIDLRAGPATSRVTMFPEQMVNTAGNINIPFAGQISVKGRTPTEIEAAIIRRLAGKANQPQVLVKVVRQQSSNVTVIGEFTNNLRMPLSAGGERILDALAAAGGVKQPVARMTLQLTRAGQVRALPLETIIQDPRQNLLLQPGDILTSLSQPLSFTVLGAAGKNEEINFEAKGISLAQALGRAGGLQDTRADAKGVFIFRYELPAGGGAGGNTVDGRIPVVYRADLREPSTLFVAQNFQMQNGDVLYVSNAPAADLQKFLNIMLSVAYPVLNVINTTQ
jgi:polysaccharide export outer membrane protein